VEATITSLSKKQNKKKNKIKKEKERNFAAECYGCFIIL